MDPKTKTLPPSGQSGHALTRADIAKGSAAIVERYKDPVLNAQDHAKVAASKKKNKEFARHIKNALEELDPKTGQKKWIALGRSVVDEAIAGNMEAVRIVALYTDGKPVPSQEELEASGVKIIMLPTIQIGPNSPTPTAPADFIDAETVGDELLESENSNFGE